MLPGSQHRLAAPELDEAAAGERLLELSERYCAVVQLPDDIASLRRMVLDQHGELVRMALWLERMAERLERTERRLARLERRP